jgi:3-hydroxyisobutyrate dehydrogenase
MTEQLRAGFIGVGNMGGAMAARLCELGWKVGVRDVEPAREAECVRHGAEAHPTPASLAAAYPVVVVAVVDAAQCDEVLFGAAGLASAPAGAGAGVVLCPTLGPASTEAIAARLGERGIACSDAPMSGGPARARDGSMSLMVACSDALFDRQRGLLEALSSKLFRVGERAGDGARTKLVNNLLAAINLAGAAEAIGLAERLGLDAARTLAVIEQSSGQSWIGSDRMRRALAGDWAPRAHTTLLLKDSGLALEMAAGAGFDAPLGSAAAARFRAACEAGFGDLDDASLLQLLRESPSPARGRGPG